MKKEKVPRRRKKEAYEAPKVLATYTKEEVAETIRPHGDVPLPIS